MSELVMQHSGSESTYKKTKRLLSLRTSALIPPLITPQIINKLLENGKKQHFYLILFKVSEF